jgi:hypothetical protein
MAGKQKYDTQRAWLLAHSKQRFFMHMQMSALAPLLTHRASWMYIGTILLRRAC